MDSGLMRELLIIGGVLLAVIGIAIGVNIFRKRQPDAHPTDEYYVPSQFDEMDTTEFPNGGARKVGETSESSRPDPIFDTDLGAYEPEPEHRVLDEPVSPEPVQRFSEPMPELDDDGLSKPRPLAEEAPSNALQESTQIEEDDLFSDDMLVEKTTNMISVVSEEQNVEVSDELDANESVSEEVEVSSWDEEYAPEAQDVDFEEELFGKPVTQASETDQAFEPAGMTDVKDEPAISQSSQAKDPLLDEYDNIPLPKSSSISFDEFTDFVIVNVQAHHPWNGRDLLNQLIQHGLRFGYQDIFHRMPNDQLLFSIANGGDSGVFDLDLMVQQEKFNGISCFIGLPAGSEVGTAFEEMLATASNIAENLGGELLDDQLEPLTQERVGEMHEKLVQSLAKGHEPA